MPKPNKSILKRLTITKHGKIIRRKSGQNHFNAKESRRSQRRKNATVTFSRPLRREILMRV